MSDHFNMRPVIPRLQSNIRIAGECHIWTGAKTGNGYGTISFKGRYVGTHRAAYLAYVGDIPNGMLVCHRCDTPLCINPTHLFLGTTKDNSGDCMGKSRQAHGERNAGSKLKEHQVLDIRNSTDTVKMLVRKYSVHKTTIYRIRRRSSWKKL